MNFKILVVLMRKKKMKIFNKKNLLLSSAVVAGMLFTVGTKAVQADTTDNTQQATTNTLKVNANTTVPDKNLIMPVASRDNQTLRQVAEANNTSLSVLEKLNDNIDPDQTIANGTWLYLPQNEDLSLLFTALYTAHSGISSAQYQKYYGRLSASERAAKLWIANRESGYNYHARNGRYYGRFQLDVSYLHGDYSVANQERTADRYVKGRYGSWTAAKRFWMAHNWY